MFGTAPIELGIAGNEAAVLERLRGDDRYLALFAAAGEPIELAGVVRALAAFERRLISGDAPIDRRELSDAALRGEVLFASDRLKCDRCHGGFNFSVAVGEPVFFNNGLYNVAGGYPASDQGLFDRTGIDADRGRFRPPTLRNILVTAPYMHDGSVATLFEVLEIYERGGRNTADGDGAQNPHKSELLTGFFLSGLEHDDLQAFFEALTDERFLTDPTLADPW
jgi:cytochrome c peroxidase